MRNKQQVLVLSCLPSIAQEKINGYLNENPDMHIIKTDQIENKSGQVQCIIVLEKKINKS